MNWLYLAIAVTFEIVVAIAAGKAEGFRNLRWTIATLVSGGVGTYFLSLALLTFDVGVGYAMWTSVAGIGIVVLGALLFDQRLTWRKALGIAIILGGVAGLQLTGAA
ncbi:QacE family quaternary ammonium compound efflux SMR transporter [Nocardia sp. NEAU-G5]|uniref:QacE family quaternary ammonium compound efflux SMR transporter n=1 Tax=Nocardia albiluteola TaxID=2842303 RepID=A0ABS6B2J3_9NOCA|nr:SMR family transporter [Nocardia albiluteola]MBU3064518.1 QacE family quaternary ammonium compound efflux SMR transporter [Nocardia albiluteola]